MCYHPFWLSSVVAIISLCRFIPIAMGIEYAPVFGECCYKVSFISLATKINCEKNSKGGLKYEVILAEPVVDCPASSPVFKGTTRSHRRILKRNCQLPRRVLRQFLNSNITHPYSLILILIQHSGVIAKLNEQQLNRHPQSSHPFYLQQKVERQLLRAKVTRGHNNSIGKI